MSATAATDLKQGLYGLVSRMTAQQSALAMVHSTVVLVRDSMCTPFFPRSEDFLLRCCWQVLLTGGR